MQLIVQMHIFFFFFFFTFFIFLFVNKQQRKKCNTKINILNIYFVQRLQLRRMTKKMNHTAWLYSYSPPKATEWCSIIYIHTCRPTHIHTHKHLQRTCCFVLLIAIAHVANTAGIFILVCLCVHTTYKPCVNIRNAKIFHIRRVGWLIRTLSIWLPLRVCMAVCVGNRGFNTITTAKYIHKHPFDPIEHKRISYFGNCKQFY